MDYKNNGQLDLDNLTLVIDYPPAFQYSRSSLEPDQGQNQWQIGGLHSGSANDFNVFGNLVGPENSFFNFQASLQAEIEDQAYVISQADFDLTVQSSPLDLSILINDVDEYVADLDDPLKYTINYQYTSQAGQQATIEAKTQRPDVWS